MRASVAVIENFARIDHYCPNQSFAQEKGQGIINGSLGHAVLVAIDDLKQLLRRKVLCTGEEDAGNGDALGGWGNTVLSKQADSLSGLQAGKSGVC